MKICLVGTLASSTINFRKHLIRHFCMRGYTVYVFATDYTVQTKQVISALGAMPVDFSLNRSSLNFAADIVNMLRLKKKFKKIAPDVVFSFFSKPVIFSTLAAKLANVPRIVGMLEGLGYVFTRGLTKREVVKKSIIRFAQIQLYRLAFLFLDRIIFLNSDDPINLVYKHGIKARDVSVLGGVGVDLEVFAYKPPPTQPIRFIFVGRLLLEKGIREFVEAAKVIKLQFSAVEFIALGTVDLGNPASLTEQEVENLEAQKVVIFPGYVADVQQWLQDASIFVLPSYYREGLPRSTQEAMAVGRAVITTDVPGCRDTVKNGENGFLIPVRSVGALVEKMIFFINNRESIMAMGLDSRRKAEREFCIDSQTRRLVKMIMPN